LFSSLQVTYITKADLLGGLLANLEGTTVGDNLDVGTIGLSLAFSTKLLVILNRVLSETPVLRDENLLGAGEFVLATTETFDDMNEHRGLGSHRDKDLVNVNTGDLTIGLTEGTSHTGLETIGTST